MDILNIMDKKVKKPHTRDKKEKIEQPSISTEIVKEDSVMNRMLPKKFNFQPKIVYSLMLICCRKQKHRFKHYFKDVFLQQFDW